MKHSVTINLSSSFSKKIKRTYKEITEGQKLTNDHLNELVKRCADNFYTAIIEEIWKEHGDG